MRVVIWLVLILASADVAAQYRVVQGRVTDSKSQNALPFATVYFNNTTTGTTTDRNGDFQLQVAAAGEYELIVSYVGYRPFHATVDLNRSDTLRLSIQLEVSLTSLGEVKILGKKDAGWHRDLKRFEKLFFGEGEFGEMCRITNPWLLEFKRDSGNFRAESSEPLEIENLALGYKLTYLMTRFEVTSNKYNISGYVRFHQLETPDSALVNLWAKNRLQAYRGSPRHLFKSLIDNEVGKQGFVLYQDITGRQDIVRNAAFPLNVNESITSYTTFDKVLPGITSNRLTVKFPSRIEVHYTRATASPRIYSNVSHPVSWVEVTGGSLSIDSLGMVVNPSRLVVLGSMSEIRVANILPLDYSAPQSLTDGAPTKPVRAASPLLGLIEKPYLLTDRPYYYVNDLLFFKAHMNYTLPMLRDSLSHVLHVQLLDESHEVVASKVFPIISGTAAGDFWLNDGIRAGHYQLRAFTNWMLNFNQDYVFQRPIRILSADQLVRASDSPNLVSNGVTIHTDKEIYQPREKILVTLEAIADVENLRGADLVVSVVDMTQAAHTAGIKSILNSFSIHHSYLLDSVPKINHAIQYGIPFSGKFLSRKKNQPKGVVSIYQNNTDDVLHIRTDDNGKFYRELQVMDTTELYLAAKSLKGRSGTVAMDSGVQASPEYRHVEPLVLDTYRPADPSLYHISDPAADTRMLKEVTITGKRVSAAAKQRNVGVDFTIDGQSLRNASTSDFLSEVQRRIPGLRIVYKIESNGTIRKYIAFSALISFSEEIQEPLVLLDGISINNGDESAAERLSQMNPVEIEKLDVVKFGGAALYGARAAAGVIIITTTGKKYPVAAPEVLDKSKMQSIKLHGYSVINEFESPDHSEATTTDDRLDVRSTIYWNPWIKASDLANVTVSFHAADIPTRYLIVVEGLSRDRKPYRAEKIITISAR